MSESLFKSPDKHILSIVVIRFYIGQQNTLMIYHGYIWTFSNTTFVINIKQILFAYLGTNQSTDRQSSINGLYYIQYRAKAMILIIINMMNILVWHCTHARPRKRVKGGGFFGRREWRVCRVEIRVYKGSCLLTM